MTSTAAINRPHPGPNTENHSAYNNRVPNPGLHDPGLQNPQDLGPHMSARPIMCVPVPPPPPFLHYQWPMPLSYNPFTAFPGMGYGMVMPPFPPPLPYMEAPAYVMPHPQFQPVDYRRLLHPAVPVPSAPHQHPNQPRRARPPHTAPVRETMNSEVQTEPTQRGPDAPGEVGLLIPSDSGHGTMSNSPSSSRSRSSSRSSSSSHRRSQAAPETGPKDFQVSKSCSGTTVTQGLDTQQPLGTKPAQQCTRKNTQRVQEMVPLCRDSHCNMWSVGSPDDIVLVCNSTQHEDKAVPERRVSVPDILMSWVGASPQEVMLQKSEVPSKKDKQLSHDAEVEKHKSEHQSPAEDSPVVDDEAPVDDDARGNSSLKDTDTLFKIIKLPLALQELLSESIRQIEPSGSVEQPSKDGLLHSFDQPQRLLDSEQDSEMDPQADTSEIKAFQAYVDSFQMRRKMNDSIWSVESLAPFFPNKESLQQSFVFEPKAIAEMVEQGEIDGLVMLDNSAVKPKERRRSLRFSSSDSVLTSDNMIVFSTPAVEQNRSLKLMIEDEPEVSERRDSQKGQNSTPTEEAPLTSPPQLQGRISLSPPTKEEADGRRSSEPEAPQSPNQKSLTPPEQEKSPRSSEQEETLLINSAEEEKLSPPCQLSPKEREDRKSDEVASETAEVRHTQLDVPAAHQGTVVSPSKGIDFGVQCGVMEEIPCACDKNGCGQNKKQYFKYSDVRDTNCRAEGYCANGQNPKNQKRNGQWKHRGQEKQNGQMDGYNGYSGKPGRSRGGNGRNNRY